MKTTFKFIPLLLLLAGVFLFTACGGGNKGENTEGNGENEEASVKEEVWNIPMISETELRKAKEYKSLEEALAEPDKVYKLNLAEKKLTALPEDLFKLKHLQRLRLAFNRDLKTLDPRIGSLKNLQYISLHSCGLTTLPKEIGKLPNLETLIVESNKISSLPAEIGSLPKIKELKLSYNELTALPEEIYNLSTLENLYLHRNQISTISDKLGQLTNLKNLTLGNNQISAVPATIKNLSALRYITLTENQITALPEEIGELANLVQLYVGKNTGLAKLPESTTKLEKLYEINLTGCSSIDLEDTFNKLDSLPKLQKVWLANMGKPVVLPENVGNLDNVKALFLDKNTFEGGELTKLMDKLANMEVLRTVSITDCKIANIPANISKLKNLEYLYAYRNELKTLPATIGQISKLKYLSVSSNKEFTTLPGTIGSLRKLETLDLSYTNITALPPALSTMKQLKTLYIKRTNVPQAVADQLKKALPDTKVDHSNKQ
ncbi:hypothetical protein BKI52_06085 [marine bacterium AO1-C]|nr:hypothetical protein BKI52_06085 [marine bacterium AO1-C]